MNTQSVRILMAENDSEKARLLLVLLRTHGYTVDLVPSQAVIRHMVEQHLPDLIIIDADSLGPAAYRLCTQFKTAPRTCLIPVVMITNTPLSDDHSRRSMHAGADDYLCLDDLQLFTVRLQALIQRSGQHNWLEPSERVVRSLVETVMATDPDTAEHLYRVGTYAVWFGQQLGLSPTELVTLNYGALLHDIGKSGISPAILHKREPLTRIEKRHIEQHTIIGEYIVQPLRLGARIAPIIRHHHERWDGRGYPDGLAGEQIPLGARIVAIVDAFDALTTSHQGLSVLAIPSVITYLQAGAGRRWDAQLIAAFIHELTHTPQQAHADREEKMRAVNDTESERDSSI